MNPKFVFSRGVLVFCVISFGESQQQQQPQEQSGSPRYPTGSHQGLNNKNEGSRNFPPFGTPFGNPFLNMFFGNNGQGVTSSNSNNANYPWQNQFPFPFNMNAFGNNDNYGFKQSGNPGSYPSGNSPGYSNSRENFPQGNYYSPAGYQNNNRPHSNPNFNQENSQSERQPNFQTNQNPSTNNYSDKPSGSQFPFPGGNQDNFQSGSLCQGFVNCLILSGHQQHQFTSPAEKANSNVQNNKLPNENKGPSSSTQNFNGNIKDGELKIPPSEINNGPTKDDKGNQGEIDFSSYELPADILRLEVKDEKAVK